MDKLLEECKVAVGAQYDFHGFESATSTMDLAKEFLHDNEKPQLVMALGQTKGRGRKNRDWVSEKGSGLYVSFLFTTKLTLFYRLYNYL